MPGRRWHIKGHYAYSPFCRYRTGFRQVITVKLSLSLVDRSRGVFLVAMSFFMLTGAFSGCAQIEQKSRANRLDQSVRLYVNSIRWGNFQTAAALTRVRQGEQPSLDPAVLGNLRVTAYSYRLVSVDETAGEASVDANFDYYFLDSGSVRSVSQTAVWYFDAEAESWFLDGTLPDFRR